MQIAIWIVAVLALALWSLLAWGVAAVLNIDPAWVGDLRPWIDKLPFADLLDAWVPGWQALAQLLIDMTHGLLSWLGSWMKNGASAVVWIVWGIGAALMLGATAALSLFVKLVAKTPQPPQPPSAALR
jgi:hypothetical protein